MTNRDLSRETHVFGRVFFLQMKKKGKGDFMTALAVGYPMKAYKCPDDERQIKELFLKVNNMQDWCVSLVEQVRFVLNNLDASNVSEAASVKAENIDTRFAKIKSAQIQSLKADKIKTGTLHVTEEMTIQNNDGSIKFLSDSIVFSDPDGTQRLAMGRVDGSETFVFVLYDKEGNPTLTMDSNGAGIFAGMIRTGKDCYVSGELRVGLDAKADNSKNGISFYGDALAGGSKLYGKLIPHMDGDDEHVGINVTEGGLYEDGKKVLTENDYGALISKINDIERRVENLEQRISNLK